MELQRNISHEANVARIGRKLRVVVDRREGDYYVARSEYDSPEVDQEILIPVAEGRLLPGESGRWSSRHARSTTFTADSREGCKMILEIAKICLTLKCCKP